MGNYAISYFGEPSFNSPEEGSLYQTKWRAWVSGLGEALVDPGMPLGASRIVSSDGVTDGARPGRLTGYSIVKADSLDRAVELVKACPHLDHGTVEVSEVMDMAMM